MLSIQLESLRLKDFVRDAFAIVEPGTPYVHGWHIDAICDYLEAVTHGDIKKLLINIPPRHMKSLITCVFWPVWEWIKDPAKRWIFASYAQNLSIRDSLKCRRLIQSQWFKDRYGWRFKIIGDQNTKTRFETDAMGFRVATSVSGMGTGEGGDRIVCLAGDTLLRLRLGPQMRISDVVKHKVFGDVLCYNHRYNRIQYQPIIKHYESTSGEIYHLTVRLNDGSQRTLKITDNHPIFVVNIGYQHARDIYVGQYLFDRDKCNACVIAKELLTEETTVYNIEVDVNNNYFANDLLVHNCDDPHNVKEAESELVREGTLLWWDEVMSSRLNDRETGARVIIMQRVHARDLAGHVLEKGGYEHLMLPARYELGRSFNSSLGFSDPRTQEGELLWPGKMNEEAMQELESELGPYAVAGQLQQRPAPREGGLIKLGWFKYFDMIYNNNVLTHPRFDLIIQSWDTACKEGQTNDYSVCTTWGVNDFGAYLLDLWRERVDFPTLQNMAIILANQWRLNALLVEDASSGQALIQALRVGTKLPVKAVKVTKDKETRVNAVSAFIESGRVFLPNDKAWMRGVLDELCNFPNAAHDDIVDTFSMALTHIFLGNAQRPKGPAGSMIGR